MSRRDWERFGSPYDPNYRGMGKITREQEQRRNEEQYQLRGCGDPTCGMCNSHIPMEVRVNMARNGIFGEGASIRDAMEEAIRRGGLSEMIGRDFIMTIDPAGASSGPPQSYVEARKAVEKWISKAPAQDFEDIVGNEEALAQLKDAIEAPKKHKKVYEAYGMKMPKGALLCGPPGCGKTMFARAAASTMKKLYGKEVEFISISGSELQAPYVGVTEGYIKAIFTFAKEYKAYHKHPLLVFLDEAEVLLPDRTGRVRRVAPWEESRVATFLAEMDGIDESGAFLLLATNRPEVIDQAVLRDGRCDFKITVKRPTQAAVEVILRKNFDGCLMKDSLEDLVFAAVETLNDPHKVLVEAHAVAFKLDFEKEEVETTNKFGKHFLLEHIVSGAMAASIPTRAKRYAFARDKEGGKALGITVGDVVSAVNDLYNENKGLEHEFAFSEFRQEFLKEWEEHKERKK